MKILEKLKLKEGVWKKTDVAFMHESRVAFMHESDSNKNMRLQQTRNVEIEILHFRR